METKAFFAPRTIFAIIFHDTPNACIKQPKDPTTRQSQSASEAEKRELCNIHEGEEEKQLPDTKIFMRLYFNFSLILMYDSSHF